MVIKPCEQKKQLNLNIFTFMKRSQEIKVVDSELAEELIPHQTKKIRIEKVLCYAVGKKEITVHSMHD